MTSRHNRNTAHALTMYPTHPKFGKPIIRKLNKKTPPQVRRPVIVVVHVCVNKIHVCNNNQGPTTPQSATPSQITEPHPLTQRPKTSSPKPNTTQKHLPPANPYKAKNTLANFSKK